MVQHQPVTVTLAVTGGATVSISVSSTESIHQGVARLQLAHGTRNRFTTGQTGRSPTKSIPGPIRRRISEPKAVQAGVNQLIATGKQVPLHHADLGMAGEEPLEVVGDATGTGAQPRGEGGNQHGVGCVEGCHLLRISAGNGGSPAPKQAISELLAVGRIEGSAAWGCSGGRHRRAQQEQQKGQQRERPVQPPGKRRVRQSPLAVLTSTPISTGSWPAPNWSCHQPIASAQAASRES